MDKNEEVKKLFNEMKIEHENLLIENDRLKKSLDNEQFLHKNLYKEWNELKLNVVLKDNEIHKLRELANRGFSRPSFYGLLIFALILASYVGFTFFNKGNVNKEILKLSSPVIIKDTTSIDTALNKVNVVEKNVVAKSKKRYVMRARGDTAKPEHSDEGLRQLKTDSVK